jgi:hypothetical protein
MKKNNLKVVYEDDLIRYLKSIKVYDAIMRGDRLCIFCGNKITINNLEVIIPNNSNIDIVCNNRNCLNQI